MYMSGLTRKQETTTTTATKVEFIKEKKNKL